MAASPAPETFESDPEWLKMLTQGHRPVRLLRSVMKHLPTDPRCKVCSSPFAGVGGKVTGVFGFRPSRKNPNICGQCIDSMDPGGALLDIGVLFVDLRGSTTLGEQMGAGQFAQVLNRFYHLATDVLLSHDAIIDKLIGDEVMALFIPGIAGPDYRRKTCDAGLELIRAVHRDSTTREGLAFGVGVHSGPAFVGNVGGAVVDFTALGDTVNTAARLQALAQPGELVISEELCRSVSGPSLEGDCRTVDLRGKSEPFALRVVRP
ncbi:MAG TPA: adenylate/guanylate cyclase domain-containing protein [Tepidiformaceae bacterium]|nr:adenylate/guanylate cyclase domain-containing protein [Tepidiformaceae bacterium]